MEIEGVIFLVVLFATPAFVLAASRARFFPVKSNIKLVLVSFLIMYVFIVGTSQITRHQIEKELYTYDLNGDGSFSSDEITPEAELIMDRFANDTGLIFAPITGFIFSSVYALLFFAIVKLVTRYAGKNT